MQHSGLIFLKCFFICTLNKFETQSVTDFMYQQIFFYNTHQQNQIPSKSQIKIFFNITMKNSTSLVLIF